MSTSHEISCSVTQANESTAYAATSGLSWRSWAEVSGWIMMMVIRRDPEKPIDLSSIPCHANVALCGACTCAHSTSRQSYLNIN